MRLSHTFILVAAMAAAAPAVGQGTENAAAPANMAATNAADANAAAPVTPTEAAATPGTQNVAVPPTVTTPAETGTSTVIGQERGFPWGVLGLLGLLGLIGRKRSSS